MSVARWALAMGLLLAPASWAVQPWQQIPLTAPAYDNEAQEFSVQPTTAIRTFALDAPTPTQIAGATVVTTPQLRQMMVSAYPPLLVDVLGGNQTVSLPGAVWLRGAGLGTSLDDSVQHRLTQLLTELTGGDVAKSVVFFCASRTCWLSHNAALRAVALGYSHVFWYRGGRRAWEAAGLPLEPVRALAL